MPRPAQGSAASWSQISDLIERVVALPALMDELTDEVRRTVHEIGGLDASDVARHTRALLAAATRAIAARRGPSDDELAFVAELAINRARQAVPIHAVLVAIEVAERRIWARARRLAVDAGIDPALLLDARELYDDWALKVRTRLVDAYRTAERPVAGAERETALLHRLLGGGAAASLAAAEAGLPAAGLWVWVGPRPDDGSMVRAVRSMRVGLAGPDGAETVAVTRISPHDAALTDSARPGALVMAAGPGDAAELGSLRQIAAAAAQSARAAGLSGVLHAADVAALIAVRGRADLAEVLLRRHGADIDALGARAAAAVATTRAYLEASGDADAAAARQFVHPNTVRNRLAAVASATGIDPRDPFRAVNLWWLCAAWQERRV